MAATQTGFDWRDFISTMLEIEDEVPKRVRQLALAVILALDVAGKLDGEPLLSGTEDALVLQWLDRGHFVTFY